MRKKLTILFSFVLVIVLLFLGAALRHASISGEPVFSEKNFIGAIPLFGIVLLVVFAASLIPWEKTKLHDDRSQGPESDD